MTFNDSPRSTLIRRGLRLILFAAAVGSAITCVSAGDKPAESRRNATLRGDYGLSATGIRAVPPRNGVGQTGTHATIALRTYAGKGGFKGMGVASNGLISGLIQGTPTSG